MARRFVYRLVIDSWPTADGRPFTEQPVEFWQEVVDAYANPRDPDPTPGWVPNLAEWLPSEDGYWDAPPERAGRAIRDEDWRLVLNVPYAPPRRYFQRKSLDTHLVALEAWGCKGHIERAELSEWQTV